MTYIAGEVAPGWEPVRDAFVANFEQSEEVGAGVAVYHRGNKVVDLVGGSFDADRTGDYTPDALQLVFSTTKGITAIAVAMCVERGLLDYDEKVSTYWPEFAQAGKGDVTVAQLLSHQVGLPTIDGKLTLAEALDWPTVTAALAAQAPLWEPGTGHGYHALSYGWLAGELVRRVDPKERSLGGFVADEIVTPLGASTELWIGLPEEQEARLSPIIPSPPPSDPAMLAMMQQFMGPDSLAGRALSLNGAFVDDSGQFGGAFNRRDVHAAEVPAANGITNAASLARVYSAVVGEVDGVRLLGDDIVARASTCVTPAGEPDNCLMMPTTFGMGFMTSGDFSLFGGGRSFGHPGAGGSVGYADPDQQIGFGYVMNQMATNMANDQRAASLSAAVNSVLA
jgi:CubicO group peptidase (beta-lactamase class C family)